MNINEIINRMPLKEDKQFIREQLSRFHPSDREGIFKGYLEQWKIGKESTEVSFRKQNAGRFKANQWLIER